MQNSSARFGMVSHCQAPVFADFPGVALSAYGGKADVCARRGGSGAFGAQICRSPQTYDGQAALMNCSGQKRLSGSEQKAHLAAKAPRSCFSLPPMQDSSDSSRKPPFVNDLAHGYDGRPPLRSLCQSGAES
ncbi:unnamed protein product [Pleuronectes platessa]|uniref:Uncharacterized protein n=1 Tax=Pleuronectes platessa TaxID=8262 RepID=A0A9N7VQ12_PLEPL|nr:unnamed protein product [Pleuronectes platessa]